MNLEKIVFSGQLGGDLPCSFVPGYLPCTIHIIIGHKTIIMAIHQGRGDHEIGGGAIAGNWNVPNDRHAQERLDIWIVGHRFKRIPEKDEKIDLVVSYFGSDLLITAQWSTLEFGDFNAKLLFQDLAGCPCRIYSVVSQEHSIIYCPFNQIALLVVVRDKSDLLIMFHGDFFVSHTKASPFPAISKQPLYLRILSDQQLYHVL